MQRAAFLTLTGIASLGLGIPPLAAAIGVAAAAVLDLTAFGRG